MAVDGAGSLLLLAAGALAGVIGTAGGITSLVSYPALLAAGLGPLAANVANLVALVACWPSSALASRRELRGNTAVLATALPVAALAGGAGSLLLVATPPGVFGRVVPWLVLTGSAVLVAQPAITARRGEPSGEPRGDRRGEPRGDRRGEPRGDRRAASDLTLLAWIAVLCVYGGYFGAGSGIMLLAALLLLHESRLPHANALKNMLVGAGAVASAVLFALARPIVWSAVAPLAAGLFLGSLVGPAAARRLPAAAVRWGAAILGVALAVDLWVHPG